MQCNFLIFTNHSTIVESIAIIGVPFEMNFIIFCWVRVKQRVYKSMNWYFDHSISTSPNYSVAHLYTEKNCSEMNKQKIRNRNVNEQGKKKNNQEFTLLRLTSGYRSHGPSNTNWFEICSRHATFALHNACDAKCTQCWAHEWPYGRMRSIASDSCWEPAGETTFSSEIPFFRIERQQVGR